MQLKITADQEERRIQYYGGLLRKGRLDLIAAGTDAMTRKPHFLFAQDIVTPANIQTKRSRGGLTVITGPRASGKTTLIRRICETKNEPVPVINYYEPDISFKDNIILYNAKQLYEVINCLAVLDDMFIVDSLSALLRGFKNDVAMPGGYSAAMIPFLSSLSNACYIGGIQGVVSINPHLYTKGDGFGPFVSGMVTTVIDLGTGILTSRLNRDEMPEWMEEMIPSSKEYNKREDVAIDQNSRALTYDVSPAGIVDSFMRAGRKQRS